MEALDADTIRNWSPGSSTVSLDRGFRGHGFADGHKASGSVFDKRQPNVGRSPTLAQQPSSSTVGQIWASAFKLALQTNQIYALLMATVKVCRNAPILVQNPDGVVIGTFSRCEAMVINGVKPTAQPAKTTTGYYVRVSGVERRVEVGDIQTLQPKLALTELAQYKTAANPTPPSPGTPVRLLLFFFRVQLRLRQSWSSKFISRSRTWTPGLHKDHGQGLLIFEGLDPDVVFR
ncbi:hypothetical protein BJ912DRAFT_921540 [Pholiota molesta]|nr:hypothetical protein BJ912DRAFT_921540 [Pholiota molesta]